MRLGVLPVLAAAPFFLAACSGDDNPSEGGSPFPLGETAPETDDPPKSDAEEYGIEVFDEAALEGPNGVQKILTDDYMLQNIDSVDCPADQVVELGRKFLCTVRQGGEEPRELTVQITVTSDDGQYQVALPEESK